MSRSDEPVVHLWPEFPALIIQDWLKLPLGLIVYYHFFQFGVIRVVFAMKIKSPSNKIVKIEERTWPDWPILEIQDYLKLDLKSMVDYAPMGSENKIGSVGINPTKINIDQDTQREIDDFLSNIA
jgi:hypothetical protein